MFKTIFLPHILAFVKSSILAQARGWSYTGAGALISHGFATQAQYETWAGVIFFVITALLQLADNFIVDGKITYATNQPAPAIPAKSVTVAAAQATMQPIPNP